VAATLADIIKTMNQPEILQVMATADNVDKPSILFDRKTCR